ncbi:unnamed protein product [Larinioides sclopetarius]|uniref:Uncharacterized protein n=1 Tax=Larinioides sclopetarius TaxID=280406 RepID=A0AAV1Z3Y4_9ARAC
MHFLQKEEWNKKWPSRWNWYLKGQWLEDAPQTIECPQVSEGGSSFDDRRNKSRRIWRNSRRMDCEIGCRRDTPFFWLKVAQACSKRPLLHKR